MADPKAPTPPNPPHMTNPGKAPEAMQGAASTDPEQDEAYPRPRVRLAANWVQPRRAFNFDRDYHNLPRFRPDYGRKPMGGR